LFPLHLQKPTFLTESVTSADNPKRKSRSDEL
jgi:hypothetical protein